jgi:hypothetical protein
MPHLARSAAPPPPGPALNYSAMRLRWCGLALRDFLRRWAIYAVVGAAVASAGAVGWHHIIAAVSAWFVMPLFYAASQGAWLAVALPVQVLFGTACVWAARNLLWPPHWAESERALPIARAQLLRSDATVVLIALIPLFLLYVIGAASLLGHKADWLMPVRGRAVSALLLAALLTVVAGVALLQRLRLPRFAGVQLLKPGALRPAPLHVFGKLRWPLALIAWPLWRGPARRTGFAWAAGAAALLVPAPALVVVGHGEPWFMAGASLLCLMVATRVNALARIEFAELFAAALMLPLAQAPLQHARAALGLLAVVPGLLALCATAQWLHAPGLRPAVLWAWPLACLAVCFFEVQSQPAEASNKAGRWLLSLVVCVCLATEVLA